ncbi:TipAS antibiotic-recognition domain-containing protein [Streptomyces sp900105245]
MGNSYEDECRRSLAEEQAKSLAGTNNWEHVDRERVHQDWDVLYREITAFLDGGSLPGDQKIQELVRRHFDIVSRFYTPSREAYVGMSLFYAEDEAMRAFHDSYHPGMVEFLGAAIRVFAEQGSGFAPSAGAEASAWSGDTKDRQRPAGFEASAQPCVQTGESRTAAALDRRVGR